MALVSSLESAVKDFSPHARGTQSGQAPPAMLPLTAEANLNLTPRPGPPPLPATPDSRGGLAGDVAREEGPIVLGDDQGPIIVAQ